MTMWLASTFPVWLLGIILVASGIVVGAGGALLFRQRASGEPTGEYNQVATSVTGIVGSMYTLVLGFCVFLVWTGADGAGRNVDNEARQLQRIYSSAIVFEQPARDSLRERIKTYVRAVIENEWSSMASGREGPRARDALLDLDSFLAEIRPQTEVEFAAYALSMNALGEITASRAARLLQAQESLPATLWVILILGWIALVSLTWLFRVESAPLSAGMSTAVAVAIGLVLLVVLAFNHPFTGDLRVDPGPFQALLQTIERSKIGRASCRERVYVLV